MTNKVIYNREMSRDILEAPITDPSFIFINLKQPMIPIWLSQFRPNTSDKSSEALSLFLFGIHHDW